jgi:hypothetical protein
VHAIGHDTWVAMLIFRTCHSVSHFAMTTPSFSVHFTLTFFVARNLRINVPAVLCHDCRCTRALLPSWFKTCGRRDQIVYSIVPAHQKYCSGFFCVLVVVQSYAPVSSCIHLQWRSFYLTSCTSETLQYCLNFLQIGAAQIVLRSLVMVLLIHMSDGGYPGG